VLLVIIFFVNFFNLGRFCLHNELERFLCEGLVVCFSSELIISIGFEVGLPSFGLGLILSGVSELDDSVA
jgi:hypothetical protein